MLDWNKVLVDVCAVSFLGTQADGLWCIGGCHNSQAAECMNMPWSQDDNI